MLLHAGNLTGDLSVLSFKHIILEKHEGWFLCVFSVVLKDASEEASLCCCCQLPSRPALQDGSFLGSKERSGGLCQ